MEVLGRCKKLKRLILDGCELVSDAARDAASRAGIDMSEEE